MHCFFTNANKHSLLLFGSSLFDALFSCDTHGKHFRASELFHKTSFWKTIIIFVSIRIILCLFSFTYEYYYFWRTTQQQEIEFIGFLINAIL